MYFLIVMIRNIYGQVSFLAQKGRYLEKYFWNSFVVIFDLNNTFLENSVCNIIFYI